MVSDEYVKYEEAEVHRSAIMQDFLDNEKKLAAILDFISAKFVMGYSCVRHYILFYIYYPAICTFLSYLNIIKLIKFKMVVLKLLLPKVNQAIG